MLYCHIYKPKLILKLYNLLFILKNKYLFNILGLCSRKSINVCVDQDIWCSFLMLPYSLPYISHHFSLEGLLNPFLCHCIKNKIQIYGEANSLLVY